jgi:DNA-binding CsgD family transcriptional regulator/tetratricopeptide (TPR) repeat protein
MSWNLRLKGREDELEEIGERLAAARSGRGSIVLVAAGPGVGKSRLLSEALLGAERAGVRAVSGAADQLDQLVPLAPLLTALFGGERPLLDPAALRTLSGAPEERFWALQELQRLLEEAAAEQPLMIALDDLQWADDATLSALRTLAPALVSHGVVWLLTRLPHRGSAALHAAIAALAADDATRELRLEPLPGAVVERLATDALGATPGPELHALLARAEGNPLLLDQLLHGLVEEDLAEVVGEHVELRGDGRLPDRLMSTVRDRSECLSGSARETLEIASVLGSQISVEQLAQLLDKSPTALLAPLQELFDAGVLMEHGGEAAFRYALLRDAVHDGMPGFARSALHRQAADVLVAAGGSPVQAAAHLANVSDPGDRGAVATLRAAASELAQEDPVAAAELGMRALELTLPGDELLGELRAETIGLLVQAGRLDDGRALSELALGQQQDAQAEASLRLRLAQLFAPSAFTLAVEHCRRGLALDGVDASTRTDLLAMLALTLTMTDGAAKAREVGQEALAEARAGERPAAEAAALVALSAVAYGDHRWLDAAELVEEAVQIAANCPQEAHAFWIPEVWQSHLWTALDRVDDALALSVRGIGEARREGRAADLRLWATTRCRLLFDAGKLCDAREAAEALLAGDGDAGDDVGSTALYALARIAVHTGDRRQARAVVDASERIRTAPTVRVRSIGRLFTGLVAESEGDFAAAMEILAPAYDALDGAEPALASPEDPTDEPRLVRIALHVGDRERAELAAAAAGRRAERNTGVASLEAAALHARALLDADAVAIDAAAQRYRAGTRPLGLAAALEDAGQALASDGARDEAVARLDEALALYGELGAGSDAARVRRRLRELGVRRRAADTSVPPLASSSSAAVSSATPAAALPGGAARSFAPPASVAPSADSPGTPVYGGERVDAAQGQAGAAESAFASRRVRAAEGWELLTEAELQVVHVVADGATNRKAAERLFVSPHTVSSHLRHAFAKLGINSRVELARIVAELEAAGAATAVAVSG